MRGVNPDLNNVFEQQDGMLVVSRPYIRVSLKHLTFQGLNHYIESISLLMCWVFPQLQ